MGSIYKSIVNDQEREQQFSGTFFACEQALEDAEHGITFVEIKTPSMIIKSLSVARVYVEEFLAALGN